jgi:hypothetical protein
MLLTDTPRYWAAMASHTVTLKRPSRVDDQATVANDLLHINEDDAHGDIYAIPYQKSTCSTHGRHYVSMIGQWPSPQRTLLHTASRQQRQRPCIM